MKTVEKYQEIGKEGPMALFNAMMQDWQEETITLLVDKGVTYAFGVAALVKRVSEYNSLWNELVEKVGNMKPDGFKDAMKLILCTKDMEPEVVQALQAL